MSKKWMNNYDKNSIVLRAYSFAKNAHKDEKRRSGDPFITHCVQVGRTVHNWGLDEATIAAALLHDVVEDTPYSLKDLEDNFGTEVSLLVDGLTKLEGLKYTGDKEQAENLRKLMVSISKDLRVIFIKLADRLHNMSTLGVMPKKTQQEKSGETYDIYAPLAYRLGMQRLSGELNDLAFPYLYPTEYKWLTKNVESEFKERQAYVKKVKPVLNNILEDENIHLAHIDARAKRYSSLYKKLIRYDMDIGKIYDLVAIRVIVNSIEDCYAALGAVHKNWPPLPGRIKDYIALPKPNGYRSLHTTVFCIDDKITEIQIRTQNMHEEAELGAAAHWSYQQSKDTKAYYKGTSPTTDSRELLWVKQLRNWQEKFNDSEDFIESLKIEFFKDRIFVVTPHNDVLDLPAGSTPIDFAYRIHSEVGNQCAGAKVNGKLVSLDYQLMSGDVVEILTQKGKKPSDSWLDFVKTTGAKERIRSALKRKQETLKKKSVKAATEFKITTEDRTGLIKDISSVFSRAKINITAINSNVNSKFPVIVIRCNELNQNKVEKLLVKIKNVPGVREVSYKTAR